MFLTTCDDGDRLVIADRSLAIVYQDPIHPFSRREPEFDVQFFGRSGTLQIDGRLDGFHFAMCAEFKINSAPAGGRPFDSNRLSGTEPVARHAAGEIEPVVV